MPHSCFIHSSTDAHLGYFHILVIVNNTGMAIGVFMFFQITVLGSFAYISRSGIAGSKGGSIFNFLRYHLKNLFLFNLLGFRWFTISDDGSIFHGKV